MIPLNEVNGGLWAWLNNDTILRSICGSTGRIVKGQKRPDSLPNPCITIHMPTRIHGYDWAGDNGLMRTSQEPVMIACFADLEKDGRLPFAQLSTMCTRVHTLACTSKPTISGGAVSRLGAYQESGAVFDERDAHEAYMVISLGVWIRDTS